MGRGASQSLSDRPALRAPANQDQQQFGDLERIASGLQRLANLSAQELDQLRRAVSAVGQGYGLEQRWAILDHGQQASGPKGRCLAYRLDDQRDVVLWPRHFQDLDAEPATRLLDTELGNIARLARAGARQQSERRALLETIGEPLPTA